MSNVQSLRERFLARVEQVRVRVPIDQDAVADLNAAYEQRSQMVAEYNQSLKDWESGKRKLTDTQPAEPDYAAVDQWIADADRKVDENSLVVVLQWVPKVYPQIMQAHVAESRTALQTAIALAGAFYLRTEAVEGGDWSDLSFKWEDLEDRLSEGELVEIGNAAHAMANASDAAPFVKRSKNSKPD